MKTGTPHSFRLRWVAPRRSLSAVVSRSVPRLRRKGRVSSHTIDSLRWNIDEELLLAMTYNAVFDESGKHADSEVVIFAGFFSTDEKWTEFGREWKTLLRKNDLTHFHMVDAVQTNGQFRKFRKQKSALSSLVVLLADLLCQYAMEGTINQVSTSHFNT